MEYRSAYAQLRQACQQMGSRAQLLEETPSTQDEALRLARTAPNGGVVLAVKQTAGRGRSDRTWASPCGGIWGSWIFRDISPTGLTLLGSLAVARVAEQHGLKIVIRWPNDVLVGRRKLSGVLADVRSSGSRIEAAILGVGVNVNILDAEFDTEIRGLATSFQIEIGHEVSLTQIVSELDAALARVFEVGWFGSLEELRSRMIRPGTTVDITVDGKTRRVEVDTLAQDGGLKLRDGTLLYRVDRLSLI